MKVFVTVGTTSFDKLIKAVDSTALQHTIASRGFNEVVMQIGRGVYEPDTKQTEVSVDYYRYKDSLLSDIESADLVISHAGAGSCLEILGAGKPLVVVVNEDLMNNHQIELAAKLAEEDCLYYCFCSSLDETLKTMDLNSLKPFTRGQPEKFGNFMSEIFDVS